MIDHAKCVFVILTLLVCLGGTGFGQTPSSNESTATARAQRGLSSEPTAIATPAAQNQAPASTPTETDTWVTKQIAAGQPADLDAKFPAQPELRKMSAKALENILTGKAAAGGWHRNGARILGATIDDPIDLTNAQIPGEVWLMHCTFNKKVNFMRATFAGVARFDDTTFKDKAIFDSIKVGHLAFFRNAIFEGPANFNSANITWQLHANGAQFRDVTEGASFNGLHVGQVAFFHKAVFDGPVDFRLANIGNNFEAQGARFNHKAQTVAFTMTCGRKGYFWGARFAGPVSFVDASFGGLFIGDESAGNAAISRLDLTRCAVSRQLQVQHMTINKLIAPAMVVGGPANFTDLKVNRSADLSYGSFANVDLSGSTWPKNRKQFQLQGISYKYIGAAGAEKSRDAERKSHAAVLKLVARTAFAADVYRNLEDLFSRQGYPTDADEAFVQGKRRERAEYFKSSNLGAWLWSLILDGLVLFGRESWRIALGCAAIVGIGCWAFPKEKMELQEDDKKQATVNTSNPPDPLNPPNPPENTSNDRTYNRFWYSLGLFLPFVDLQSDSVWKPKKEHPGLRQYMRVHILLGWILIPIALAAVTGLIK